MSKKFVCLAAVCVALAIAGSAGAQVGKGKILFEYWDSVSGTAVSNLTSNANYPNKPTSAEWRDNFKSVDSRADNYGIRARAYLTPPADGDYTFWVASDDNSELWLSTDDNPANAVLIAKVTNYTGSNEWNNATQLTQKSAVIPLKAGKKYFIQGLQKEGTGGDNFSVGWAGPVIGTATAVISGQYCTAFIRDGDSLLKASKPDPSNGKTEVTNPLFQWTPGLAAVLHEVYVGKTATLTAADFMGPWPTNMYFHIPGLTPGATYYWRVDEVAATGEKFAGDVWSFTVQPLEAHLPTPGDGSLWRALDTQLKWTAGQGAVKHKVYVGSDKALVTAGDAKALAGEATTTSFSPTLASNTQYYWRVDEVDSMGKVVAGPVWSFSTIDTAGGLVAEYWNDINLVNNWTIALAGKPAVVKTVQSVNFSWPDGTVKGTNSPDPNINTNYFAARYTAILNVPVTGAYTLYFASDDGGRLLLNGTTLAMVWGTRGETENGSPVQNLVAGQPYVVVMEMFEATGGAAARLRWAGPGIAKEIIPPGALQIPKFAVGPYPASGGFDVLDNAVMTFTPGQKAVVHTVYFGTDKAKVTASDKSVAQPPTADAKYTPAKALAWNTTYYWKVDEMAADGTTAPGQVWSFKTADFLTVQAAQVAGIPQPATLAYDNTKDPFMSQLVFAVPADLTVNGVSDLALRFQGALPPGSSVYTDANQSYTVTGSGADIWGTADAFQYVYKTLTGDGSMVARVTNIGPGANTWAKGGVMIRQSLNANSMNAYMPLSANTDGTAGNGASWQWRPTDGGSSSNAAALAKVAPPYWVKVERKGNAFSGFISPDGKTWTQMGTGATGTITVAMKDPVYIGLAVTSHVDAATMRTVKFDNVSTTGNVTPTGPFTVTDVVGYTHNDPDPLYVAVEDKAGKMALVTNPNPAAANRTVLDLWRVPMSAFKGVDLKNAVKLYVGMGSGKAGGMGTMTFADIRIVKPVVSPDPNAVDITKKGDPLVGLPNDGVNAGGDTSGWPAAEVPINMIDDSVATKFLHFKGDVEPTGFSVTPSVGGTVVTGLTFTSANDWPSRDPITWELYGSYGTANGPWEFIARGTIDDFSRTQDWPRQWKTVTPIGFANGLAFTNYKVMFPTLRYQTNGAPNIPNSMQIAEVELLGRPASVAPLANPIITSVLRAGGYTETRDPIGAHDGSTPPLPMGLGGLKDGNMVYSDRTYPWNQTPKDLIGAEYVRIINSDKNVGTVTYTVTLSRAATVAVAHDDRNTPAQAAVDKIVAAFAKAGQFKDSGLDIFIYESASTPARPLSLFTADLAAGIYVFGAEPSGNTMYIIGAIEKK